MPSHGNREDQFGIFDNQFAFEEWKVDQALHSHNASELCGVIERADWMRNRRLVKLKH